MLTKNNELLVELPVIVIKRPVMSKIIACVFMVSFLFSMITIVVIESKVVMLVAVFTNVFLCIVMLLLKKNKTIGYIIFYLDHFVVKTEQVNMDVKIIELLELKFSYGGLQGDLYILNPWSISRKDGDDNFLYFQINEKKYVFEVLVYRENLALLKEIFHHWKNANSNFILPV